MSERDADLFHRIASEERKRHDQEQDELKEATKEIGRQYWALHYAETWREEIAMAARARQFHHHVTLLASQVWRRGFTQENVWAFLDGLKEAAHDHGYAIESQGFGNPDRVLVTIGWDEQPVGLPDELDRLVFEPRSTPEKP